MARKERIRRTKYTKEYRDEAVRLVNVGDRTMAQIGRALGVNDRTLWNWVRQAEVDAGKGKPGDLTTEERAELAKLRRENEQLREEREILKKATAFFVRENK
jgi:transposase